MDNEKKNGGGFQPVDISRKNKPVKLSAYRRDLELARDLLAGSTYAELARRYGISNATISYRLNKPEIKEVIEDALNHLASFAPIVVKNYRDLLSSNSESIRLKATQALADILGLRPSAQQSQVNVLYVNQSEAAGISDAMRNILQQIDKKARRAIADEAAPVQPDILDAEFYEVIDDM